MAIGFVFPGQGSQKVGMLAELAEHDTAVKKTFAQASEVLNYDLWDIVSNGPDEKLNSTDVTQPAMLAAGYACWIVWQNKIDVLPDYMAGHSLGEYTALVASGVIDFQDAITLVRRRGELMQAAVPAGEGAMAAILGLDDEAVITACSAAKSKGVIQAVNFNAPGQVVIAGNTEAVEAAAANAKEAGAKRAVILPVSVPSHCSLMQTAADELAMLLNNIEFKSPTIPVINNVDVAIENDSQKIKSALAGQLHMPVRWVEIINLMANNGVDQLLECGPGRVLVGLNKRINKSMSANAVYDVDSFEKAMQSLS